MESRSRPLLALLLLIPAPSIGVLANGILAESNTAFLAFIGLAIWALCKVWIFGFPVIWHIRIDGGERGYSLLLEGSGFRPWIEGLGLGLALSIILVITFLVAKPFLDIESIGASIRGVGLDSWSMLIPAILFLKKTKFELILSFVFFSILLSFFLIGELRINDHNRILKTQKY